ncbi:MAG: hypothetical protein AAGI22_24850 [Planctomycetota bacterium]
MDRDEDLDDGAPEAVWPPRPEDVPAARFADADAPELRLDHEAVVPEPPEFTPSKLTAREHAQVAAAEPEPAGAKAVVFDPKNPSGRTRYHEIFEANDEDFRRRRSQLRQESGLAGAFVFLVCMASFQPFTIVPFLLAAVVGAAAGVAAEAMGDRSEIWLFTALVGGVLLAPVVKGMTFLIFLGAIAGGGWLTGFVREVR